MDSSCKSTEYCDKQLFSAFGVCKEGHEENHSCMFDSHCASKQCSYFKCVKRVMIKDGPCKQSADCPNTQYCDDIDGRSDLRRCYDRKCSGACRKDSMCLSDKCFRQECEKPDNMKC
jgi:hypothetical protein